MIIGEAASGLSKDFRAQFNEIPWPQIIGLKNILVHAYFSINPERIWPIVERDLPVLKAFVKSYCENEDIT